MKRSNVAASFLQAAKEQLVPTKKSQAWRAYTRSGKVVVILDRQVVDIIDPRKAYRPGKEEYAQ